MNTKKTIIVMGNKRGGTSLVSGVVRKLGIFMGDKFSQHGGNEDIEISQKDLTQITKMIIKRNEDHDVWGWKDPDMINNIHYLLEYLVNPIFLIAFRDVAATALSESSRQQYKQLSTCLWEAKVGTQRHVDFALWASVKGYSAYSLSHEKAILNPENYVRQLAELLEVPFNQDAVDFINPVKGYQNA